MTKLRTPVIGLLFITLLYVAVLLYLDKKNGMFRELASLLSLFPFLFLCAFTTWVLRYCRWRWLLQRAGHEFAWVPGFLAYLAGFAYTATPGKVGELLRIRYFAPMGVPAKRVFSTFAYERSFDLIVILVLSSFIGLQFHFFWIGAAFAITVVGCVFLLMKNPYWLLKLNRSKMTRTLVKGFRGIQIWLNLKDMLFAFTMGLITWSLLALSFVYLLGQMNINIPFDTAFAIYPVAMLAGAASMLPGGLGSTEGTIIALLGFSGVGLALATLAAVGIRIVNFWFAVVCGLLALLLLEFQGVLQLQDTSEGE